MSIIQKKQLIELAHPALDLKEQCQILNLPRSTFYYKPARESDLNLEIMNFIDRQHTDGVIPYGQRKIVYFLKEKIPFSVNRKRIQRLMRLMGIEGDYVKKRTTYVDKNHKKYPYLLRNVIIFCPDHVWSTDITYIPMRKGFMYLTAVIDWFSRYVLSWTVSNSLENNFCIEALLEALKLGQPVIFNTDQGSQFTSPSFTDILLNHEIMISMDGKGRCLDNVFVERLWRTVKYEYIYRNIFETPLELIHGLTKYFSFYNNERIHQSLDYKTPNEVYKIVDKSVPLFKN